MNELIYQKLTVMASQPEAMELSVDYIESNLKRFLKRRDKVLILFPDEPATIGRMMKEAVLRCEAIPQFLEGDHRWLTMLKTAFITKSDAIVGPPLTMLGLAKLAKHRGTPLFARNVLVAGYPSKQWMVEGIERGLDCRVWGCYDPGSSTMIAGFTCKACCLHLRENGYQVRIVDEQGKDAAPGALGRVLLSDDRAPELVLDTGDFARLDTTPCACGGRTPRLVDVDANYGVDQTMAKLAESFHYWGSILDCKLANTGYGLELELTVFPGEKLPKFPNCAKLVVKAFNPESDEPYPHGYALKKRIFSTDSH